MKKKNILSVLLLASILISSTACGKQEVDAPEEQVIKQVKTFTIDKASQDVSFIDASGSIKAEAQVEVTAAANGTVRGIHFKVGNKVQVNKILASLYDSTNLSNLNNAQTNQNNMKSNLEAIGRITDESIRQAEIGVQSAEDQITSAEIALKTTQNNLENARELKDKGNLDLKNQAIISLESNLNSIDNTLKQVNYLIHVDKDDEQIEGIEKVIAAKDKSKLKKAIEQYNSTVSGYNKLKSKKASTENITTLTRELNNLLTLSKTLVDDTIEVLANTVSNQEFTATELEAQKANFIANRSSISTLQTAAKINLQNLQNQGLTYNQEIDALTNAVSLAENQLESAKTGYENALISLENAKQSKEQQLITSKSALDNAQGQLNLALIQSGELNIKAPISGEITQKYIELGTEINPGQKIAQISQTDSVKIEIDLPANDIYRIDKEAPVRIAENMEGEISYINSVADPVSKKIKIEILYNNQNKDLIPGTFINVQIPIKKQKKTTTDSVYVPIKAVNITQTEKIVYILEDNKAKKVLVETGNTDGKTIEIISGLKQDDQLIISGNKSVEDGEEVELIK